MFYGNTKTGKLNNAVYVTTACLGTLHFSRRPWVKEHYLVSEQNRTLYMKTYVRFIVVGAINLHKELFRNTQYFYIFDSDMQLNTHALLCFKCNSGYASAPQCYIILHCPSCSTPNDQKWNRFLSHMPVLYFSWIITYKINYYSALYCNWINNARIIHLKI